MKARDVGIISGFELRRAMRSAHGWLYVAFSVLAYGWFMGKLFEIGTDLNDLASSASGGAPIDDFAKTVLYEIIEWFTDLDAASVQKSMTGYSPLAFTFFIVILWGTPFLTMLGTFDQLASDIGKRHARYLLPRTDRGSIYLGKFLGAALFVAIVTLCLTILMTILIFASGAVGPSAGATVLYMVRVWLTAVIFALPFIALMGLTGAMVAHPFLALLVGLLYQFVIWLFSSIGGWAVEGLSVLRYGFPSGMKYQLASQDPGQLLLAAAHALGMGLLFYLLGLWIFTKRDL